MKIALIFLIIFLITYLTSLLSSVVPKSEKYKLKKRATVNEDFGPTCNECLQRCNGLLTHPADGKPTQEKSTYCLDYCKSICQRICDYVPGVPTQTMPGIRPHVSSHASVQQDAIVTPTVADVAAPTTIVQHVATDTPTVVDVAAPTTIVQHVATDTPTVADVAAPTTIVQHVATDTPTVADVSIQTTTPTTQKAK